MLKGVHQKLESQQTPAFFVRGPSSFSRMVFFFAISISMMAIDARLNYLSRVRQTFIAALHPLEVVANAPGEWYRDVSRYFSAHNQLVQENYMLKQQAFEHKVALQRLSTIESENIHLRSLLDGNLPIHPNGILGEVSHMGRDPFTHIVVINRGTQHRVKAGQAVVDSKGVIGQVTRVYPFTSEVTLITDKELSIPIQIERNQLRAIAFGEGNNTLDIPYLPTNVDIKVGDKLVTSGIDGIYPAGLAVATVTKIQQNPESPFAKIISTPIAEVTNHLQLLLLDLPEVQEAPDNPVQAPAKVDAALTNSTDKKPAITNNDATKKKAAANPKLKVKPDAPN